MPTAHFHRHIAALYVFAGDGAGAETLLRSCMRLRWWNRAHCHWMLMKGVIILRLLFRCHSEIEWYIFRFRKWTLELHFAHFLLFVRRQCHQPYYERWNYMINVDFVISFDAVDCTASPRIISHKLSHNRASTGSVVAQCQHSEHILLTPPLTSIFLSMPALEALMRYSIFKPNNAQALSWYFAIKHYVIAILIYLSVFTHASPYLFISWCTLHVARISMFYFSRR